MSVHKTMDKLGASVSAACAVHCLLAPVLITIAPLIGLGFLFSEKFEVTLILVSFSMAFLSLVWGFYKKHRDFLPILICLTGFSLVAIAHSELSWADLAEPVLMGLGGISIMASHLVNLKLCKNCESCSHH